MIFMASVTHIWFIVHSLALGVGVGGEEQKVDKIPLMNIPWLVLSIVILFVGIILYAALVSVLHCRHIKDACTKRTVYSV